MGHLHDSEGVWAEQALSFPSASQSIVSLLSLLRPPKGARGSSEIHSRAHAMDYNGAELFASCLRTPKLSQYPSARITHEVSVKRAMTLPVLFLKILLQIACNIRQ